MASFSSLPARVLMKRISAELSEIVRRLALLFQALGAVTPREWIIDLVFIDFLGSLLVPVNGHCFHFFTRTSHSFHA